MAFNNVYKGRRVLITGNTGFKGSWLSAWLLMMGADVYGYSLDIPTSPSMFETLKLSDRMHHYFGDIRDKEKVNSHTRNKTGFYLSLGSPSYRLYFIC